MTRLLSLLSFAVLAVALNAHAEAPSPDAGTVDTVNWKALAELSLEDLLNAPIEVATRSARRTRESPGILSVVTRDEILASGARDLQEVLELVPGFSFHMDVQSTVGVGFRGLWGHEGKVLLLVDGIEMNELLYSTLQFGHHQLVHAIERVEIIRGPGSAIYGGAAELAVINVVTRGAREVNGIEAAGRYGQMRSTYSDRSLSLSAGARFESLGDLDVSLAGVMGQGTRGFGSYTDYSGGTYPVDKNGQADPAQVNVALSWKGISARFLYDHYAVGAQDGFGTVTSQSEYMRFQTLAGDLRYEWKVSSNVTVKPRVTYRYQVPWQSLEKTSELFYDKRAMRLVGGVLVDWLILDKLDLNAGVEGTWDHAALNDLELIGAQTDFRGAPTVNYGQGALYAQLLWDNPVVNVAAGARAEYHNQFGFNFAPRLGLTKRVDAVHMKLLYSGAFRSPGIENINLSSVDTPIRSERTHVAEAEVGLTLSDVLFVSANGFYTNIQDPIVYGTDVATNAENYRNEPSLASAGMEFELQLRGRHGFLKVGYAFAAPTDISAPSYVDPQDSSRSLGFANHKLSGLGRFRIWKGLGLGGSLVAYSARHAYTQGDGAGVGVLTTLPPSLVLNLNASWEDLLVRGLTVQVGVGNVFDSFVPYVQPYAGDHAAYPNRSREVFVRLSYALHLDDAT